MSATSLNFSDTSVPFTAGRHAGGRFTVDVPSVASAAALVRRVAAEPRLWQDRLRFGHGDERWYARLDVDPDHEVWLIAWLPGQDTGLHDHGEALGAFTVVRGALTETTVTPADGATIGRTTVSGTAGALAGGRISPGTVVRPTRRHFAAGQVRGFGYEHVHDVANTGDVPAVSIHAYAPELTAMTRYAVVDRRLTVLSSERAGVDW
ncbi:cysteine dioxygenase [Actinopolymorpha rutila]|uniref:Putative metal-dependent enzyme (Double-stranded beta helix superfamily) n=1 Tax=Actinopolymorpha rutila TaxID=446787 RepID=A0A852ZEP0_9ACTN|nr:cysteine dioxygenase family protein [Actinopolymorpha rutila]NYH87430.1 putative metal-dependent enzyme (double-stranded beta helix superfamily) [Actinopolymorpha rutila]